MKLFLLITALVFTLTDVFSQNVKVSVLNDTTEVQEYENGQKLKVNYRLNGKLITIKEKDRLIGDNPGIHKEFNIRSMNNESIGEINFLSEDVIVQAAPANIAKNISIQTLDISGDLNGKKFPDFNWPDISNNVLSLRQLKGKAVVLNFWHTSCVPCIAEMPLLNELVKKYSVQDVVFISATPNNEQELKEFLMKREFDYRQVPSIDTKTIFSPFPGWPIHVVLDRDGLIRYYALGKQNDIEKKLAISIDKILQETITN